MTISVLDETSLEKIEELTVIARGPWHLDISSTPEPEFRAKLEYARAVLRFLAGYAGSDDRARAALVRVVQETDWFTDEALDALLPHAADEDLCRLAVHFCGEFWQPGDYGGGVAPLRRLRKVVDALNTRSASPHAMLQAFLQQYRPATSLEKYFWGVLEKYGYRTDADSILAFAERARKDL